MSSVLIDNDSVFIRNGSIVLTSDAASCECCEQCCPVEDNDGNWMCLSDNSWVAANHYDIQCNYVHPDCTDFSEMVGGAFDGGNTINFSFYECQNGSILFRSDELVSLLDGPSSADACDPTLIPHAMDVWCWISFNGSHWSFGWSENADEPETNTYTASGDGCGTSVSIDECQESIRNIIEFNVTVFDNNCCEDTDNDVCLKESGTCGVCDTAP